MAEAQLNPEKRWCTTEIRTIPISLTWTIKNFGFLIEEDDDNLRSPYYSSNRASSDTKWCLALAIIAKSFNPYDDCYGLNDDGEWVADNDYLSLSLCSSSPTEKAVFAKYTFFILDKENEKRTLVTQGVPIKFHETAREVRHSTISISSLNDDAENLLPDDTLTILCEITYRDLELDYVSGPVLSGRSSHRQLSRDFEELLKKQLMSDVKLVTNGETFNAHKAILAARSHVFAGLFSHKALLEGKKGKVKIEDVDKDVLREVLHYIYTGKTGNVKNMVRDVLPVADKYDLGELKEECELLLADTISIENAAELLTFANFHSATQLKAHILNFVKWNGDAVIKTPGWNILARNNSDLLNDVEAVYSELTNK